MEQLAAQQSAAVSPPQDTWELDRALAHIFEYQKVIVDEANKTVVFIPGNPAVWSSERPVWIVGVGSRTVFHKGAEHDCRRNVLSWLEGREDDGWTIKWPEAEGTMEEMKGRIAPRPGKLKKQEMAAILGRVESIRNLALLAAAPPAAAG
jgi:hypothetical protein